MLDVLKLKAEIVRNGYTQRSLSDELGMSAKTFSTRLKTGDFGVKEIECLTSILHLKNPYEIFFGN